jgi:voltage-gated potassium channel Kch
MAAEETGLKRSPFSGENRVSWRLRHGWRNAVRPVWREARAPLVIIAGFSVIVLGTIGFTQEGMDWWEALFKSFQLFGFAGGDLSSESPATLNVARVLGPLIVGVAAVRGLLVLSREQLRLIGFRLFRRGHVVVVGLGDVGFTLAAHLNGLGARVIAIDRDATTPAIEGCKERGISALIGDASDPDVLRAACVQRAKHLIVAPGTDGVAIDVLAAATAITSGRDADPLQAIAHIEDRALWQALRAHHLTHGGDPSVRVELFNLYEAAGRRALGAHPPFSADAAGDRRGPAVLIVADQAIAEVLVASSARLWRNSRAHTRTRIKLTLAGPGSEAECDRIRQRYPALDTIADLESWEVDLGSPALREDTRTREAGAAYVALGDEAQAVAAALTLATGADVPREVVLIVNDSSLGASALAGGEARPGRIALFGILDLVLDERFLVDGLNETLARSIHDSYERRHLTDRESGELPYVMPWDELSDDGRSANRDAAADIPRKLARLGCAVVPAMLADRDRSRAVFERALGGRLEEFAVAEHDRWMAERLRSGWVPGPERINPTAENGMTKVHPSLVPYDELSESEKQKDRDTVLDLPDLLADAGFAIEPIVSAPGSAPAPRP